MLLPVSEIDRAIAFYRDKVGFALDHDTLNEHLRVVQLTPRGSGCSIVIGDPPAQREMAPDSWTAQQIKARGEKPLIPLEYREHFGS